MSTIASWPSQNRKTFWNHHLKHLWNCKTFYYNSIYTKQIKIYLWMKSSARPFFFGEHVCNDYEKAVQTTVLWWESMQQLWKSCANDGPVRSRCDNCENCANNRPTVRRYETTLKKQCKQPACREQVSNNSEKAVREMLVHEVSVHEV